MTSVMDGPRLCALCGAEIPKRKGPGRPRKFCAVCVPDHSGRAWHRANAERVNRERREAYVPRWVTVRCLACKVTFRAPREEASRLACEPWIEADVD